MTKEIRESKVEDYFVRRVEEYGGEVRKVKWIGRRGAPDRLFGVLGLAGLAEIKRPGEKLKPHQRREKERLEEMGFEVFVIDSFESVNKLISLALRRDYGRQK